MERSADVHLESWPYLAVMEGAAGRLSVRSMMPSAVVPAGQGGSDVNQHSPSTRLPVRDLGHRREQSRTCSPQPPAGKDGSGLELFRRAICERDEEAWKTIIEHYHGIVLATIRRHSAATQLREDDAYWVNRAFRRFWVAVRPERFEQFTELPAILRYLSMCAASVLLDDLRARRGFQFLSLDDAEPHSAPCVDHDELVSTRLDAAALWAAVRAALPDDTDRLVARLSFVGALSPREIFARHSDRFETVKDVYRVKRNLMERLRRDPAVRQYRESECVHTATACETMIRSREGRDDATRTDADEYVEAVAVWGGGPVRHRP